MSKCFDSRIEKFVWNHVFSMLIGNMKLTVHAIHKMQHLHKALSVTFHLPVINVITFDNLLDKVYELEKQRTLFHIGKKKIANFIKLPSDTFVFV